MINFFSSYRYLFNLRFTLLLFVLAGSITNSIAQQPRMSLYDYTPMYLNPANTGNFDGKWRAGVHYRNQWSAAGNAFSTAHAGLDAHFSLFGQKLAAGLTFINDESGIGGLTYNHIHGSVSLEKKIKENTFLIGVQTGYVTGKVNSWMIWDPVTRDFTAPNGESNFGENASYLDINAGILWKRKIGILEPEIGIAVRHLNSPNSSFNTGGEEPLPLWLNLHARSVINLNDEMQLIPAFIYSGDEATQSTFVGTDFAYLFRGRSVVKKVFAGSFLRNGVLDNIDALALRAGTTVGRIDIAVNYDITLSDLSASGSMGAFEIGIIYRSIGLVLNSYSIPCERY